MDDLVDASDELLKSCGISAGQVLKIKLASGRFFMKSSEVRLKLKVKGYPRLHSGFVCVFGISAGQVMKIKPTIIKSEMIPKTK